MQDDGFVILHIFILQERPMTRPCSLCIDKFLCLFIDSCKMAIYISCQIVYSNP